MQSEDTLPDDRNFSNLLNLVLGLRLLGFVFALASRTIRWKLRMFHLNTECEIRVSDRPKAKDQKPI